MSSILVVTVLLLGGRGAQAGSDGLVLQSGPLLVLGWLVLLGGLIRLGGDKNRKMLKVDGL